LEKKRKERHENLSEENTTDNGTGLILAPFQAASEHEGIQDRMHIGGGTPS
jgi:hypothetical protein